MSSASSAGFFGCNPFLPPETVAEILLNVEITSLVRLSRTTSAFYKFLESPRSDFIWRHARKTFKFPLPAPIQDEGWSEAGWARWIFGGNGKCMACGLETNSVPWSFSARIRVCTNLKCDPYRMHSLLFIYVDPQRVKAHQKYVPYMAWLPHHVEYTYSTVEESNARWYSPRQLDWAAKHAERKVIELGEQGANEYFRCKAAQLPEIQEKYGRLKKWKVEYVRWHVSINRFNKNRVETFCQRLRIRSVDLWDSPTFKHTMTVLMNSHEKFTDSLFENLKDTILEEAVSGQKERTRLCQASKSCVLAKKLRYPVVLKGRNYKCVHCITAFDKRTTDPTPVPQLPLANGDPNVRGKGKNGVRGQKRRELTAVDKGNITKKKQGSSARAKAVHTWDGLRSHTALLHNVRHPRPNVDYVLDLEEGEIESSEEGQIVEV